MGYEFGISDLLLCTEVFSKLLLRYGGREALDKHTRGSHLLKGLLKRAWFESWPMKIVVVCGFDILFLQGIGR